MVADVCSSLGLCRLVHPPPRAHLHRCCSPRAAAIPLACHHRLPPARSPASHAVAAAAANAVSPIGRSGQRCRRHGRRQATTPRTLNGLVAAVHALPAGHSAGDSTGGGCAMDQPLCQHDGGHKRSGERGSRGHGGGARAELDGGMVEIEVGNKRWERGQREHASKSKGGKRSNGNDGGAARRFARRDIRSTARTRDCGEREGVLTRIQQMLATRAGGGRPKWRRRVPAFAATRNFGDTRAQAPHYTPCRPRRRR